jgi:hypothetical protein
MCSQETNNFSDRQPCTCVKAYTKTENMGQNLDMDRFFTSSFGQNCCGNVRLNQTGLQKNFRKTIKLRWNNIKIMLMGDGKTK